jgi:HEPN domain-containing protein
MIRWERGRAEVDRLIDRGQVTRVQADRALADQYLDTAGRRMDAVEAIREIDPAGAFVLAYDAARLALAAVLVNQGLRPRGEGAHAVLLEVLLAQLEPPRQAEIREFSWMRRLRNDTQYPDVDRPSATADDLAQAIPAARAVIRVASTLLPHMPPY